jgi:hypothetical protein
VVRVHLELAAVVVQEQVLVVLVVQAYSYSNTLQHNQQEQYFMLQAHSLHSLRQ